MGIVLFIVGSGFLGSSLKNNLGNKGVITLVLCIYMVIPGIIFLLLTYTDINPIMGSLAKFSTGFLGIIFLIAGIILAGITFWLSYKHVK